MRTALLLLCLLWSLVEVHSQTQYRYPYVSFIGGDKKDLPNHVYVDLNQVGVNGSHSVRCHTDLNECCDPPGDYRGDWIPPSSEMGLSENASAGIYQVQGEKQRVILRRRNNADMPPSGIYRCDIPTNAVNDINNISVRESVYVGLYATGGNCHSKIYTQLYHSNVAFYTSQDSSLQLVN